VSDVAHDTWIICRHKFAVTGESAVITVNTTLAHRLRFADYPFHVAVAIRAEPRALDASGRINAHESQHLLHLSRVIREHLECEDQHLLAIVHGAGARTLEFQARDSEAVARRLTALRQEKTWDRPWTFAVRPDPAGKLSAGWRTIVEASEEHHLSVTVPQGSADHHHFLF
jgi:hypothetical protein